MFLERDSNDELNTVAKKVSSRYFCVTPAVSRSFHTRVGAFPLTWLPANIMQDFVFIGNRVDKMRWTKLKLQTEDADRQG
jgi:hypothetical protein